jgi:hypothetical protein
MCRYSDPFVKVIDKSERYGRLLVGCRQPRRRTLDVVTAADQAGEKELVVAEDGSIPADQLRPLGLRPGAHLRVIETTTSADGDELEGSLSDLPELEWEDFERASELTRRDLSGA